MFETRLKKIFDILTSDMKSHTSVDISNKLNCSSRTIREDLKTLDRIFRQNGACIDTVAGKGSKFTILNQPTFENFLKGQWHKYAFEKESFNHPQYRQEYILRCLLFNKNFVKIDDLCEELLISRSQFHKDIKLIKESLSKYNITLMSKPYAGIKISGTELNKRLLIANYLHQNKVRDESYYNFDNESNHEMIGMIKDQVMEIFQQYKFEMSQIAFNNLIIHLYIAIRRIQSGDNMVDENNEFIYLESKKEYYIAQKITNKLSSLCNISFPNAEIAYIAIHLLGKKINNKDNSNNIPCEVEQIIEEMLLLIRKDMELDLLGDLDLRISLGLHITPLMERIKYGLVLNNPVLEEIKKNVFAFDVATKACTVLNNKFNIQLSEDEIGYIALHIGVAINKLGEEKNKKNILIICGSGIGTANMMKYRFLKEFEAYVSNLETCDYVSANSINLDAYDLIITSVPVEQKTSTPIIEVGLFMNKEDLGNIRSYMISSSSSCGKFFSEALFIPQLKANTYQEALSLLSKKIESQKNLDGDLLSNMIKREKLAPTVFDNLVAMPHPLVPICRETFITISTTAKPIKWKDKIINFIILLNIKQNENSKEIEEFYSKLGDFMSDNHKIKAAIKTKSLKEFLEIFNS